MSEAIEQKAKELCSSCKSQKDQSNIIAKWITENFLYDYIRAKTADATYLPNVESIFQSKKGICWDFAMLFSSMLTAVGIQNKVAFGWADGQYHAWNEVYIINKYELYDITSQIIGKNFLTYEFYKYYN